jgi:hypothetical protein
MRKLVRRLINERKSVRKIAITISAEPRLANPSHLTISWMDLPESQADSLQERLREKRPQGRRPSDACSCVPVSFRSIDECEVRANIRGPSRIEPG